MFIATLIANGRLSSRDISAAEDALEAGGIEPYGRSWIEEDSACDILFAADPMAARAALEGLIPETDVVVQGEAERRKKLLVADMDSTIITVECVDELADYAGARERVAAITERAMRGELDFEAALRERVALLKGLDEAVLARCYEERVRITPGAEALVRTMRANGARCLLVSGGFTFFAEKVAAQVGFDDCVANLLEVAEGRLTGTVPARIVGSEAKLKVLDDALTEYALEADEALAVGDGANDIPMIEAAGLGIAFRAKPKTAAAADARIDHGDLTALLFAQGYARADWSG